MQLEWLRFPGPQRRRILGAPYYDVPALSKEVAWSAHRAHRIGDKWIIAEDFSARLDAGADPQVEV